MTVTVFIFLIVFVFTLYQVSAIFLNVREIRRLRDICYQTKTQHSFGIARQNLMLLAARKEVSDESITFLFFYLANTTIMRHPDKYKDLSKMLRDSLLENKQTLNASPISKMLKEESETWNENVKQLINQISDSMTYLMIAHSPVLRTIWLVAKLFHRVLMKTTYHGLISKAAKLIAKNNNSMNTFVEAKEELSSLARAVQTKDCII